METYRVLWLCVCVPLGVIGAAVALANSPAAVAFLFIVFGVVGSLLTLCLVDALLGARHGRSAAAPGWRRAGRRNQRRGLRRVRVPPGPGCPPARSRGPGRLAVRGEGAPVAGSDRSAPPRRPSWTLWRAPLPTPAPSPCSSGRRRSCATSPTSSSADAGEPATSHLQRQQSSAVKLIAAVAERQMYLDELERRNSERVRGLAGRGPRGGGGPPAVPHRGPHRCPGRRLGRADPRTRASALRSVSPGSSNGQQPLTKHRSRSNVHSILF